LYGSIVGGALLVAGLYSVLWGKSREAMESEEGKEEQKDIVRCRTSVIIEATSM
jgi:hypothetical protein